MSKDYTYSMPQQFMDDPNVALKWKLYGYLNGFWLAGKPVFARNDTIAKQFGKAERSVQEALAELEKMGLITRDIKGLSRYILPGGLKEEGRGPASPTHEAQPHQGDEAQPHHISDSISDINSSVATAPPIVVSFLPEEKETVSKKPAQYPNADTVFSWFPKPEVSWKKNRTEREHAEFLFLRGEEAVRGALSFHAKHKDYSDRPKINKPSDLERKWNDLIDFAERNGL